MRKSGYFQKTGCIAYDADGITHEIVELHIQGIRYAIRRADLTRAIAGKVRVQIEALVHNWQYYLGSVAGLAQVSASGKALNIDLFRTGNFTVSLLALKSMLFGRERSAVVVMIPEKTEYPFRKVSCPQQRLEASVS